MFIWKNSYIYPILGAATFIAFFFFNEEKILLPKWGTLLAFAFLGFATMIESWEAWKRKGTLVISDLGIGKGGATGFNPSGDLRLTRSTTSDPSFAVIATGGFDYAGFSTKGRENFIVCPPEHITSFSGHLFVRTRLRHIKFNNLQKYIQDELEKLPSFKREVVAKKANLWFGMTSSYFGTDTQENIVLEQKFLDKMIMSNEYSHMLDDLVDKKTQLSIFKNKTDNNQQKYKVIEGWKDEQQ